MINAPLPSTIQKEKIKKSKIKKTMRILSYRHEAIIMNEIKENARASKKAQDGIHGLLELQKADSPVIILPKLYTMLDEMVNFNQASELDVLDKFFSKQGFHWSCGFGHRIEGPPITTVEQLKQIIDAQRSKKKRRACKYGHESILLISGGHLLTVSAENLKGGKIHGSENKDKLRQ